MSLKKHAIADGCLTQALSVLATIHSVEALQSQQTGRLVKRLLQTNPLGGSKAVVPPSLFKYIHLPPQKK
jgi:hypothetical protein